MNKKIRALSRGLSIVSAMNDFNGPVSLNYLHQVTELDRATILRILATLESEEWVYRGMSDNLYRLTYKLHELGEHVSFYNAIAQVSAPVMDALQKELHWPSDISVYDGDGMSIIETSRKRSPFVINREVVGFKPSMLRSAMGRAFLAYCDERTLNKILKRLKEKGGEDAELANNHRYVTDMLDAVRLRGYATRDPSESSLPSETEEEFNAIAVPIIVMGDVQASLNIVWMKTAYKDMAIDDFFYEKLKLASSQLSIIFQDNKIY